MYKELEIEIEIEIEIVSSPWKSKECIDDPAFALVGYIDLMVFQN